MLALRLRPLEQLRRTGKRHCRTDYGALGGCADR